MTNTLTLRSFDVPSIHKFAVGFDSMFDEIMRVSAQQSTQNYPPYNVVKHTDDKFVIELAVAGFREGDITVTVEKNLLTIEGDRFENETETSVEYLHRGISSRSFTRTFTLADHVEVVDASSTDGILSITLERKVPEELQPKKIAIAYNK
jgi:molecular chaperone IbpA